MAVLRQVLQPGLSFLHLISGKTFWFFSAYFPSSSKVRTLVESVLLQFYQWEIRLSPDLSDAYSKIGSLLANRNQHGRAVVYFTRALEAHHPDAAKIHYFMGRQKAKAGDIPGAVNCFQSFVRIAAESKGVPQRDSDRWSRLEDNPDFDANRFPGYLYLGGKCLETGLLALAMEFLQKSLTLEPLVIVAHKKLADTLFISERPREAFKVAESAHYFHLRQSHPHLKISTRWRTHIDQPDFLIVGKTKCGTTSLYSYLVQHPCIVPALDKELGFFNHRYERGLDWYLAQFPPIGNHPKLITGEASTQYGDSALVPERIRRHFPGARMIFLLRNPVERSISAYHMDVRLGLETRAIGEALLGGIDPGPGNPEPNQYVECSTYLNTLKLWMSLFPREQFLILPSEQFFATPGQVTNRVFEFLGQMPFTIKEYRVENKGTYPSPDQTLRQRLREYFLPHNRALEEFLGMRFGWDD